MTCRIGFQHPYIQYYILSKCMQCQFVGIAPAGHTAILSNARVVFDPSATSIPCLHTDWRSEPMSDKTRPPGGN